MINMKNILVLGANGSLAKVVIPVLLNNKQNRLTLLSRQTSQLRHFASDRVKIIQADILNVPELENSMLGQDIVYANLAGSLPSMAKNIVQAMSKQKIKRLIWISSMGIYDETSSSHGSILDPYRQSANIIETSHLDYTIIRPAWFTHDDEIDYSLTHKGQPFIGDQVSRRSIADLIAKLIDRPDYAIGESLGIAKSY